MEMNIHVDTCVLVINFAILEYSSRVCHVYPYSYVYEAIKDIPIARGATAVQDQGTGESHIIVFNEGLCNSNRMNHALINPNQLKHFQIDVCGNPYDKDGMHIMDHVSKVSNPLLNKETIVYPNENNIEILGTHNPMYLLLGCR